MRALDATSVVATVTVTTAPPVFTQAPPVLPADETLLDQGRPDEAIGEHHFKPSSLGDTNLAPCQKRHHLLHQRKDDVIWP